MIANKNNATLNSTLLSITRFLLSLTNTYIKTSLAGYIWDDLTTWNLWSFWDEQSDNTQGFDLLSDPIPLRKDEQLRHRASINFIGFYNYE